MRTYTWVRGPQDYPQVQCFTRRPKRTHKSCHAHSYNLLQGKDIKISKAKKNIGQNSRESRSKLPVFLSQGALQTVLSSPCCDVWHRHKNIVKGSSLEPWYLAIWKSCSHSPEGCVGLNLVTHFPTLPEVKLIPLSPKPPSKTHP